LDFPSGADSTTHRPARFYPWVESGIGGILACEVERRNLMRKSGEPTLERILELVGKCPKELQQRCFEMLLSGYVKLEFGMSHAVSNPRART